MEYYCSKCGNCCRIAGLAYPDLNRGDGVCKFYNEETKLCKDYENRPEVCRTEYVVESLGLNPEFYSKVRESFCKKIEVIKPENVNPEIFVTELQRTFDEMKNGEL